MTEESLYELACPRAFEPVVAQVKAFITERIEPLQQEYIEAADKNDPWSYSARQTEIREGLKAQAREQKLWNFFLPDWNGVGVTNLEYAYLASEMGRTPLASEVFNCSAPDTGNMEVLAKYGSEAQQERWLKPLLAGEIRSAFAMTEPEVASSDAKNIATRAVLEGEEWVINGEKFFASGAGDPRCKVLICMVLSNPEAHRSQRHSQILVPIDTPGVRVLEGMQVFGEADAPHGHMHIKFENVRVPKDNIILGEGRGFEISQGRLGPGRIHHCMRLIGACERAIEMMVERGSSREAFGKPLLKLGGNYDVIARSRLEVDASRLMLLRAARAMDVLGTQEARVYISGIKAMIPELACTIIDRAIQMHGAAGVSQWTPLASMYTHARMIRLADGPDEVHRMVVARAEIAKLGASPSS